MSAWTTNSLLTLIVLVAGLGFGRQVLTWWTADAPPPLAVANRLGDSTQLHTIDFGDNSWSLRRRSITGDKDQAVAELRGACRKVLEAGSGVASSPVDDRFLTFLTGTTPVEQQPGEWRLYELNQAFPMAVGLRRPVATSMDPAKSKVAEYRTAVWGLAMPMGERQWMLSTFQTEGPSGERSNLAVVPLPPGSDRTLSLSAAGGGIISFSGPDRPTEWKQFYDNWFAQQGGHQTAGWQSAGQAWHAMFTTTEDSVDIRFGPDARGGLSGLLMLTPHKPR